MSIKGHFCLLIKSIYLDFEQIEATLQIEPTSKCKKGETHSQVIGESQFDVFSYAIKFNGDDHIEETLDRLLNMIFPHKEYLQNLSISGEVQIRCYVQSELAQIYIEFSSEICKRLAEIGLKLSISIFSWGGAEVTD